MVLFSYKILWKVEKGENLWMFVNHDSNSYIFINQVNVFFSAFIL